MTKPYLKRVEPKNQDFSVFAVKDITGIGVIYFLGSENGKEIKIGFTKNWKKRSKTHREGDVFGNGGAGEVLALIRGKQSHEGAIHSYFKAAQVRGKTKQEVFKTEAVLDYVCWLRDQYYVSISEDEFHTETGQSIIEASFWLPTPERISFRRTERNLFSEHDPWSVLPSRNVTGDDYFTPKEIIKIAHRCFGVIDLDPASHVNANRMIQAKSFFTEDQDDLGGLGKPWFGRVWLNPPFSEWELWAQKARSEFSEGNIEEIILLAATRTMTAKYFRTLLSEIDAIAILTGRHAFWGISCASTPPDGHFLMYRGPLVDKFIEACEDKAVVFLSKNR